MDKKYYQYAFIYANEEVKRLTELVKDIEDKKVKHTLIKRIEELNGDIVILENFVVESI